MGFIRMRWRKEEGEDAQMYPRGSTMSNKNEGS